MPHHDNHLINDLPKVDRLRLLALCESVDLTLAQVLCTPGQNTLYAYFPTSSFISMIAEVDEERGLEVGMAGCEGMMGVHLLLGVDREPLKALVQGAGAAWRVPADQFRKELLRSPALRSRLQKYIYVLMEQRAVSSACLRFHEIGPRLSRWLLMSQDRAGGDHFAVTQEFISHMLGVRRVGVTVAAGALQRQGLIHYQRGQVTVLDRAGLEASACSCYAAGERMYQQQMGDGAEAMHGASLRRRAADRRAGAAMADSRALP